MALRRAAVGHRGVDPGLRACAAGHHAAQDAAAQPAHRELAAGQREAHPHHQRQPAAGDRLHRCRRENAVRQPGLRGVGAAQRRRSARPVLRRPAGRTLRRTRAVREGGAGRRGRAFRAHRPDRRPHPAPRVALYPRRRRHRQGAGLLWRDGRHQRAQAARAGAAERPPRAADHHRPHALAGRLLGAGHAQPLRQPALPGLVRHRARRDAQPAYPRGDRRRAVRGEPSADRSGAGRTGAAVRKIDRRRQRRGARGGGVLRAGLAPRAGGRLLRIHHRHHVAEAGAQRAVRGARAAAGRDRRGARVLHRRHRPEGRDPDLQHRRRTHAGLPRAGDGRTAHPGHPAPAVGTGRTRHARARHAAGRRDRLHAGDRGLAQRPDAEWRMDLRAQGRLARAGVPDHHRDPRTPRAKSQACWAWRATSPARSSCCPR
jgi:hypothetical protein